MRPSDSRVAAVISVGGGRREKANVSLKRVLVRDVKRGAKKRSTVSSILHRQDFLPLEPHVCIRTSAG